MRLIKKKNTDSINRIYLYNSKNIEKEIHKKMFLYIDLENKI